MTYADYTDILMSFWLKEYEGTLSTNKDFGEAKQSAGEQHERTESALAWAEKEKNELAGRMRAVGLNLSVDPRELGPNWSALYYERKRSLLDSLARLQGMKAENGVLHARAHNVELLRRGIVADKLNFGVLALLVTGFILVESALAGTILGGLGGVTLATLLCVGFYALWSSQREGFLFGAMSSKFSIDKQPSKGVGMATLTISGLLMLMTAVFVAPGTPGIQGGLLGAGIPMGIGLLVAPGIGLTRAFKHRRDFVTYSDYYFPRQEAYTDKLAESAKAMISKRSTTGPSGQG